MRGMDGSERGRSEAEREGGSERGGRRRWIVESSAPIISRERELSRKIVRRGGKARKSLYGRSS